MTGLFAPNRMLSRRTRFPGVAVCCAASAAAVWLTLTTWSVAAPPAPQPVHTPRDQFRIPFQFDPEEMARLNATEIQLFVSTDQGRHWDHSQSVPTTAEKFTFKAPQPGEYWFSVRTRDANNQFHPPGPLQPGLRVIVDQRSPQLEVRLRQTAAGEVELSWRADDEHLDLGSLKLEFMNPGSEVWEGVNITPVDAGRTSWTVPADGRLFVRGTVSDYAGNTATSDAATDVRTGPVRQPGPVRPDFSQPVAGPETDPIIRPEQNLATVEQPTVIEPGREASSRTLPPVIMQPIDRPPVPKNVTAPPELPLAPFSSESGDANPSVVAGGDAQTDSATEGHSAEDSARNLNTTTFNINYALEDVGPSGVAAVDLYISENNGFKWYYYGRDEDRRSPIQVTVPRDGSYGFSLRVRSGVGLTEPPPQPGEAPTLVVVVDRQAPAVEVLAVKQGQGTSRHAIEIAWSVDDERLAEKPIMLLYASQATGPWYPMTTDWIENTGTYRWDGGQQIPQQLFVRVEARDAAGNVGRADSRNPLVVDLARPSARITDIESINDGSPE